MIIIHPDQQKKIELLDKLFSALSVNDLQNIADSEQIVAKLKGTNNNSAILKDLIQALNTLHFEISDLRSDIKSILQVITKPHDYESQIKISNLKNKHGIY